MKKVNSVVVALLGFFLLAGTNKAQQDSSITLSEIMFNPISGNNEFIELYNTSATDTIDLASFKIKYAASTADQLLSTGSGTKLLPNHFAVIFEGDYDILTGIYTGLVPAEALLLKISDNAFGSSGMANTTDREIRLISSKNDTLETYLYSANNGNGISDEKKILSKDNSQSNWANSVSANGTPGFKNSVTPLTIDAAVSTVSLSPEIPIVGGSLIVSATIKNYGTAFLSNVSADMFVDSNKNGIGDPEEKFFHQSFSLASEDSISIGESLQNLAEGNYEIIVTVLAQGDENPNNNSKKISFTVSSKPNTYNDVVINEIMYAPLSGEPEWIELFNRSEKAINIKKWKISDNATPVVITQNDVFIPPKSYLVLSRDSTLLLHYAVGSPIVTLPLPAFNNTDDAVVVKDSLGFLLDSVYYFSSWGGSSGKSLERIDANSSSLSSGNWQTSNSGAFATPGKINSVTQKDYDGAISAIHVTPQNPVAGDAVSFSATAKNMGKNSLSFYAQLFADENLDSIPDLLLATTGNVELPSLDSISVAFDFTYPNFKGTKGFFVKGIFSLDDDTTNNTLYTTLSSGFPQGTVLINEIMFAPLNGEPEWVELFNVSSDTINLKDWTLNDVYTTPAYGKITNDFVLLPKTFGVVSKDSSILNYHRIIPSGIAKVQLPNLNNDEDGVVLKDNRGIEMDSVLYNNSWGGTGGYSIERKQRSVSAYQQDNWGSSIDIEQSTPGRINSLTPKQFDLTISNFSTEYQTFAENEPFPVFVYVKNIGNNAAANYKVEFRIDSDSNGTANHLFDVQTISTQLQSGDSLKVISQASVSIEKKTKLSSQIIYNNDQDTLNNYVEKYFEPGYPLQAVTLNEVMYNPNDGAPEWVELKANLPVNLKNWSVSDSLTKPTKSKITYNDYFLSTGDFVVLAKDSASFDHAYQVAGIKLLPVNLPSLSNTEVGLRIYDYRDALIDRMHYKSSWGGTKGVSIEFVNGGADSLNWITSLAANGNSAGSENVFPKEDYPRSAVVFNEILFDPANGNTEFVEFQNISNDTINIGGWKMVDEKGKYYKLSETGMLLFPKDYFVLGADSLLFSAYPQLSPANVAITNESSLGLTNTGKSLKLTNIFGTVIDSIFYSQAWHNKNILNTKNKSLERINPFIDGNSSSNWSTSVSSIGATPGMQNSIYTTNGNVSAGISVSPNPFSPDNDGFEDFTVINYHLSQPISQTRIKIFDVKGRLVRTLLNNHASGQTGSVIFNGLDDNGNPLRIGIYIIYLEAMNDASNIVDKLKTVVVVARKL